ncbi:AGAP008056-PA-like protein [Anopheles sinensis]|uniref:AGAP008056-PA-like protein n=1 Tax=Anopheles sinensis TaxID=74873 RepID=A0A084VNC2_ANOSI|nr:AGAP008056-PA-like protein [Anopheles sinensis]
MTYIWRRMGLALLCLVLGNFVLFHDRERIVMAQLIEDETSLRGLDFIGDSPKGKIQWNMT